MNCTGFAACRTTFEPLKAVVPPPYPDEAELQGVTFAHATLNVSALPSYATPPPPFFSDDFNGTVMTPQRIMLLSRHLHRGAG